MRCAAGGRRNLARSHPEYDLEELAVGGTPDRRRVRRVRRHVEMLPRYEPRPHRGAVERATHLVSQEVDAFGLDAALRRVRGHARTLAVVVAVGRTKVATETPTLRVGDPAPPFTLRASDGSEVSLAGLRGRRVVLAFFAWAFSNT